MVSGVEIGAAVVQGLPTLDVLSDLVVFLSASSDEEMFVAGSVFFWLSQFFAVLSHRVYFGKKNRLACGFNRSKENGQGQVEEMRNYRARTTQNQPIDSYYRITGQKIVPDSTPGGTPLQAVPREEFFYWWAWFPLGLVGYCVKIAKLWLTVLEPCAYVGQAAATEEYRHLTIASVHPTLCIGTLGEEYRDFISGKPWYSQVFRVFCDSFGGSRTAYEYAGFLSMTI